MSFEISGMTDAKLQYWATKCDSNGDGKIDGDELSIFSEGKENMHKSSDSRQRTTVGGVTFNIYDIKTIQKNQNGDKFDYSVRFENGVEMQYDKQNEGNEAYASSCLVNKNSNTEYKYNYFSVENIADGDGFSVKGTHLEERFYIDNSRIDKVDGLANKDKVTIYSSVGNNNSGKIFAERGNVFNSSDLSIMPSSKKVLRPTSETPAIKVSEEHPDAFWGHN